MNIKKRTSHFSFLTSHFGEGFTLIELLTVMAVATFVGSAIMGILFSTLRGATKASRITTVKQNGNYTISLMTKMIRNARSFDGISSDGISYVSLCPAQITGTSVKITSFDDKQTTFKCVTTTPTTISSNSASLLDTSSVELSSAAPCQFTCNSGVIGITFSLLDKDASILPEQKVEPIKFNSSVVLRNL